MSKPTLHLHAHLKAGAARPRKARVLPRYPRCMAALALAAAVSSGCDKEPDVALSGEVAPSFREDAGKTPTTPRVEPTHREDEVMLGGAVAPPFTSSEAAPKK